MLLETEAKVAQKKQKGRGQQAGLLLAGMAHAQVGLRELHRFWAVGGKCHTSLLPVSALRCLSVPPERHLGNTLEGVD